MKGGVFMTWHTLAKEGSSINYVAKKVLKRCFGRVCKDIA